MVFVDVIVPLAIATPYTYAVGEELTDVAIGQRVIVPLARKQVVGIVCRQHTEPVDETITVKEIICPADSLPVVTDHQLRLWEWIASYYLCTLGEVMAAALPAKLCDRTYTIDRQRIKTPELTDQPTSLTTLLPEQQQALHNIRQAWQQYPTVLLHGVTSSGKTEIYTHLINTELQAGKQVLYLVPEIALTTQLTHRLRMVFGSRMLVYHSRMTDAQRMAVYRTVLTTDSPLLIVAARSGVFLPFRQLGLVIVDEEHEPSYKQTDPAPRYHARSVAVVLAQQHQAHTLLGTATPAVETWYNAQTGKYGLVRLTRRYQGLALPKMTLIDLNRQYHRKEMYGHFSDPLVARIQEELSRNKQIILFQNRRGYAPMLICRHCGQTPRCPDCDVPLTLHLHLRQMQCHYCGHTDDIPATCPHCGAEMQMRGFGTERLEDEIANLFPNARIARMDWDSTRHKDDYQNILDCFARHETDILIGTQMVTKGLHFDDVSLVAVLSADHIFNTPSFRSYERAYQMLEQVAGRAGRTERQGEIIIQTWDVQHPVFTYLERHDYDRFMEDQLAERQKFHFPPYQRLITILLRHPDAVRVERAAAALQQRLRHTFSTRCSEVIVPSIAKMQKHYQRQIRLRIEPTAPLNKAKQLLMNHIREVEHLPNCSQVRILPDVDPL